MLDKLFEQAGWQYKASERYYVVSCPNKSWHKGGTDRKPSCVVWPNIDRYKCYSCGVSGTIEHLFKGTDVDVPEFIASDQDYVQDNIVLDDEIMDLGFRPAVPDDLLLKSFKDRGWSPDCIKDFDLRYDEANNNLVFPVRCPDLVGAVGRNALGKGVHNYFGFFTGQSLGGYDRLTDNKMLAVVEGWTCLVNAYQWAHQLGYDIVCTFTANVSATQARMLSDTGKVLHFWFDQDKAGRKGLEAADKHIDDMIFYSEWDPLLGDIGKMSEETFTKAISNG